MSKLLLTMQRQQRARDRQIARWLDQGIRPADIAKKLLVSRQRIHQIQRRLMEQKDA